MAEGREQVTVELTGGGPWGVRFQGGEGTFEPLTVHKTIKETDDFKHTPAPVQPGQQVTAQNELLTLLPIAEMTSLSKLDATSTIEETDDLKHTPASVQAGQQFTAQNEASILFPISETTSGSMEVESKPDTEVSSDRKTEGFRDNLKQEKIEDEEECEEKTIETMFEKDEDTETNVQHIEEDAVVTDDVLYHPKLEDVQVKIEPNILCDIEPDISIQHTISPIPTPSRIIENKSNTETCNQENASSTELFNAKQYEKRTLTVQCSFWSPLVSTAVSVPKGDVPLFKRDMLPSSANISSLKSPTVPPVLTQEEKKVQPTPDAGDSVFSGHGSLSRDLWTGHGYEPAPDDDIVGYDTFPTEKKIYSSSSFYEDSSGSYPTVEEQVGLCRKIADSLSTDTNQKSRSAKLFNRRVENSNKWVRGDPAAEHESREQKTFKEQVRTEKARVEPSISEAASTTCVKSSNSPTKLKLILDPRHLQDVHQLRKEGQSINEHNVISPDVCLGLVKDLKSPVGKGAIMFAKRRQKSEKWVVDENKVKAHQSQQRMSSKPPAGTKTDARLQEMLESPRLTIVKSPWEAALESPVGSCDAAFREFWPEIHSAPSAARVLQESGTKATSPPVTTLPVDFHSRPKASTPKFAPIVGSRLLPSTNYDLYRPRIPQGWSSPNREKSTSACQQNSHETVSSTRWDPSSSPTPQKMIFRNFNVIPKTWSAARATPKQSTFKPVKVNLGLTK
ncbi:uncharacterized protein LOC106470759 [Limulus polyphemus]|uniref:Uncharacterized protein LOC106470759 n=1 Tax=Limulus polyphemus TaxID=6850 RepID=A0ABM1BQM7_LIMPO|nr:uncharacterized protein LOC106470759 [Limulus polyphemus]